MLKQEKNDKRVGLGYQSLTFNLPKKSFTISLPEETFRCVVNDDCKTVLPLDFRVERARFPHPRILL